MKFTNDYVRLQKRCLLILVKDRLAQGDRTVHDDLIEAVRTIEALQKTQAVKLPESITLGEFMKMKFPPRATYAKQKRGHIVVWKVRYPIENYRINTPEKLLGWIHHLCRKGWITPEHIGALIEVVGERGVKIDFLS